MYVLFPLHQCEPLPVLREVTLIVAEKIDRSFFCDVLVGEIIKIKPFFH